MNLHGNTNMDSIAKVCHSFVELNNLVMDSNYREEFSSVSNPEDNSHAQLITCLETKLRLSRSLESLG
jgi:hypothetical protein